MTYALDPWLESLCKYDTVYKYGGIINQNIIDEVIFKSEEVLNNNGLNKKTIKKSYNTMIECVQNLYHHSIPKPNQVSEKYGVFVIKIRNEEVEIITGNYLIFNTVNIIEDRINQINVLSKEEVKILYKKVLNNQEFSEKGGGGLGMIDIAKRAGSKLSYSFFEFDEKYSFFEFNVKI